MDFHKLWNALVRKKPELDDPKATVTMTSENLEKLLRQVYEQGQKRERESNPFGSLFG